MNPSLVYPKWNSSFKVLYRYRNPTQCSSSSKLVLRVFIACFAAEIGSSTGARKDQGTECSVSFDAAPIGDAGAMMRHLNDSFVASFT